MKINDPMKSLPVGANYYEVSEEVWFQCGPDDADRDFINAVAFETLQDAVLYVLTAAETQRRGNRLYIDLMERTAGGAHGLPVWAGTKSQLLNGDATSESGWRFSNFSVMGVERPEKVV